LLACRYFAGQYGLVEMMLSLINLLSNLFCRYYTEQRTGSDFGRSWKRMIKIKR
jgi:hypothetical protein